MDTLSAPFPGPVVRPPAVAFRLVSDARLARLAAVGTEGAMAEIFERHHQALYRYCHSLLGNSHDAADALQNTMIKALRALPGETRDIALKPWLYRIAHNESIALLRARRPDADLDAAAHVCDAAASSVIDSRERLRSLTEDLGELTERQRAALLMRELGGLQFTEVAGALQTSAAAVKQSVYEARCALQAMEEGRAMDCEVVRRTLSDGDRRMLRGMRMRGHLRACAGCHDFELALRRRPAQLAAVIPPLPIAVGTAMLHGLLGGGGGGGGGGLASGLVGATKATTGLALGAKAAAVVAVSATLVGGAVYAVPQLQSASPARSGSGSQTALENTAHGTPTPTSVATPLKAPGIGARVIGSSRHGAGAPGAKKPANTQAAGSGRPIGSAGALAGVLPRKPAGPSAGRPAETPGVRPSVAGSPAGTPGRRSSNPPAGSRAAAIAASAGMLGVGGPSVSAPGAIAAAAQRRP